MFCYSMITISVHRLYKDWMPFTSINRMDDSFLVPLTIYFLLLELSAFKQNEVRRVVKLDIHKYYQVFGIIYLTLLKQEVSLTRRMCPVVPTSQHGADYFKRSSYSISIC